MIYFECQNTFLFVCELNETGDALDTHFVDDIKQENRLEQPFSKQKSCFLFQITSVT